MVEPRREHAAEVIERRLEQAAEEGEVGMLDGLWFLPVRWLIPLLSFPLCGNGLSKPLDSSLRWNDDGGRDGFFAIPIAPSVFLTNP